MLVTVLCVDNALTTMLLIEPPCLPEHVGRELTSLSELSPMFTDTLSYVACSISIVGNCHVSASPLGTSLTTHYIPNLTVNLYVLPTYNSIVLRT